MFKNIFSDKPNRLVRKGPEGPNPFEAAEAASESPDALKDQVAKNIQKVDDFLSQVMANHSPDEIRADNRISSVVDELEECRAELQGLKKNPDISSTLIKLAMTKFDAAHTFYFKDPEGVLKGKKEPSRIEKMKTSGDDMAKAVNEYARTKDEGKRAELLAKIAKAVEDNMGDATVASFPTSGGGAVLVEKKGDAYAVVAVEMRGTTVAWEKCTNNSDLFPNDTLSRLVSEWKVAEKA